MEGGIGAILEVSSMVDDFGDLSIGEEAVPLEVVKLVSHVLHPELDDVHHLLLLSGEGKVLAHDCKKEEREG